MNLYQFSKNVSSFTACACACLVLAACETNQPAATGMQSSAASAASNKSGGHLVVHRAANLGTGLILSVDGARVAEVRAGDTYNGDLTPGRHVLTALPVPNEVNQAPASVNLVVTSGHTYSFTAARQGDLVVLAKD